MQVQVYPPHMYICMSLLLLHACAALSCYTAFLLDLRSVLRLSDRVVHVLFGGEVDASWKGRRVLSAIKASTLGRL